MIDGIWCTTITTTECHWWWVYPVLWICLTRGYSTLAQRHQTQLAADELVQLLLQQNSRLLFIFFNTKWDMVCYNDYAYNYNVTDYDYTQDCADIFPEDITDQSNSTEFDSLLMGLCDFSHNESLYCLFCCFYDTCSMACLNENEY